MITVIETKSPKERDVALLLEIVRTGDRCYSRISSYDVQSFIMSSKVDVEYNADVEK